MHTPLRHTTRHLARRMLAIYVLAALFAITFFVGARVGYLRGEHAAVPVGEGHLVNTGVPVPASVKLDSDFGLYWNVWNLLKENYLHRPISDTKLFYGSLKGLVESLGDPYTAFFDPETNRRFSQELGGKFDGIGAQIGFKDNMLTIIAPLPGTPAQRAGFKPGDHIVKIDDVDTTGMALDDAVSRIRGPQGTMVHISIIREGWKAARDFTVTRQEITVASVEWKMRDDGLAVVSIYEFGETTDTDFKKVVLELLTKNPKGIILDLRNNPGGYLTAAVSIAGEWVAKDKVVVVEQNRSRTEFKSEGPVRLEDIPTVVLVNGGSASASEILAGALQDYHLAKIVGAQTFGKGSVQDFQTFDDGSALKYTIAEWFTPLGRSISKVGITPDLKVDFTEDDAKSGRDPQLDRAVELLKK